MARIFNKKPLLLGATALLIIFSGAAVIYRSHDAEATPAGGPQTPPPVNVVAIAKEPVQIWKDFSGRLRAVDFVELRPQVSGSLHDIKFQDGQSVKKDDILFVIDPAPYEATVAQAKAAYQGAKNQSELADKELARAEGLVDSQAISKRTYDERQSESIVSKSSVESASARLRAAQIDLDHAYVKAPIAGRVSRAEITIGNVVQAGPNAPVLTTIASNEGIYADFEVDEQTYTQNVYNIARDREAQSKIPVEMSPKAVSDATYKGTIESFDNHIDPATGTIRARALFDNKDGTLLPGMFVTVRLGSASQDEAILISEKAIGTDQDRKFVYVVDPTGKVTYREIKTGASISGKRVVLSGLNEGDLVIVDGIIKIRPDMVVTPQITNAKAAEAAPTETPATEEATSEPAAQ